jgi:hypothetical protein
MRLINTQNFKLETFIGRTPSYAILSHTWGSEEVTFQDMQMGSGLTKIGYRKIIATCKQASVDGLAYAWVDTCCIDKSSSAELSESINQMCTWYHEAAVCYVLLEDVVPGEEGGRSFEQARWFGRGWTLQELLAPRKLEFYDAEWEKIGCREQFAREVEKATNIEWEALQGETTLAYVRSTSVAKRMAMAAGRQVTRAEDMAYCLLGLFDVSMPLLYGEGGPKAFERLQEEIIKRHLDQSFLLWLAPAEHLGSKKDLPLFAQSPAAFAGCKDVLTTGETVAPFTLNNQGLQLRAPVYQVLGRRNKFVAVLACAQGMGSTERLGLPMRAIERTGRLLIREAASEFITVPEAILVTAQIRDFCVLRDVPIGVPRLLSVRITQQWESLYRRETLYQEHSRARMREWQRLEAGGDIIKLPFPDELGLRSPCYGIVFTNTREDQARRRQNERLGPNSDERVPAVGKIIVRVDLDLTSRYSASVSIDEFWDEDWVHILDTSVVPNRAVSRNDTVNSATLVIGERGSSYAKPQKLTASIRWRRNAGQDVLTLDIRVTEARSWEDFQNWILDLPVDQPPSPMTTDKILYLTAFVAMARITHHYTQIWILDLIAEMSKLVLIFRAALTYLRLDAGPPTILNVLKWSLCFPALAFVQPAPAAVHMFMISLWPIHRDFFGLGGTIGPMLNVVLVYASICFGSDMPKRWAFAAVCTVGLHVLSAIGEYYGVKWREDGTVEAMKRVNETVRDLASQLDVRSLKQEKMPGWWKGGILDDASEKKSK